MVTTLVAESPPHALTRRRLKRRPVDAGNASQREPASGRRIYRMVCGQSSHAVAPVVPFRLKFLPTRVSRLKADAPANEKTTLRRNSFTAFTEAGVFAAAPDAMDVGKHVSKAELAAWQSGGRLPADRRFSQDKCTRPQRIQRRPWLLRRRPGVWRRVASVEARPILSSRSKRGPDMRRFKVRLTRDVKFVTLELHEGRRLARGTWRRVEEESNSALGHEAGHVGEPRIRVAGWRHEHPSLRSHRRPVGVAQGLPDRQNGGRGRHFRPGFRRPVRERDLSLESNPHRARDGVVGRFEDAPPFATSRHRPAGPRQPPRLTIARAPSGCGPGSRARGPQQPIDTAEARPDGRCKRRPVMLFDGCAPTSGLQ